MLDSAETTRIQHCGFLGLVRASEEFRWLSTYAMNALSRLSV
jgi:hypothetical protein